MVYKKFCDLDISLLLIKTSHLFYNWKTVYFVPLPNIWPNFIEIAWFFNINILEHRDNSLDYLHKSSILRFRGASIKNYLWRHLTYTFFIHTKTHIHKNLGKITHLPFSILQDSFFFFFCQNTKLFSFFSFNLFGQLYIT